MLSVVFIKPKGDNHVENPLFYERTERQALKAFQENGARAGG
jgi:hypothetical protein